MGEYLPMESHACSPAFVHFSQLHGMKTMADAALKKADLERIRSEIAEAERMEGEVRTFLASLAGV